MNAAERPNELERMHQAIEQLDSTIMRIQCPKPPMATTTSPVTARVAACPSTGTGIARTRSVPPKMRR
jgi:hypothetical protein